MHHHHHQHHHGGGFFGRVHNRQRSITGDAGHTLGEGETFVPTSAKCGRRRPGCWSPAAATSTQTSGGVLAAKGCLFHHLRHCCRRQATGSPTTPLPAARRRVFRIQETAPLPQLRHRLLQRLRGLAHAGHRAPQRVYRRCLGALQCPSHRLWRSTDRRATQSLRPLAMRRPRLLDPWEMLRFGGGCAAARRARGRAFANCAPMASVVAYDIAESPEARRAASGVPGRRSTRCPAYGGFVAVSREHASGHQDSHGYNSPLANRLLCTCKKRGRTARRRE